MTVDALGTDQIRNVAIGTIVGLVVVGLVLGLVVQAIIGRLLLVVIVVVLGVAVWTQRVAIENRVKKCDSNLSFFGAHVDLSKSEVAACQKVTNR
ncbi:MAG TPA: hypothetical protein VK816_07855 [Jatrophihabitantaceae bacterium]|jgi:hypothetical protein|nr:hypothetical protein [Jatrophihabitantaceae bacterium]